MHAVLGVARDSAGRESWGGLAALREVEIHDHGVLPCQPVRDEGPTLAVEGHSRSHTAERVVDPQARSHTGRLRELPRWDPGAQAGVGRRGRQGAGRRERAQDSASV